MAFKINTRQFKKWIAALDSGEYKQTKYWLQENDQYCCLGVGCKVIIKASELVLAADGVIKGQRPYDQPSAPLWLKDIDADFESKTGFRLTVLNDYGIDYSRIFEGSESIPPFSYTEIATLLELVYIHKMLD